MNDIEPSPLFRRYQAHVVGQLVGYQVIESPMVGVLDVFVLRQRHVVVCREQGQIVHILRIEGIKAAMREDLRKLLEEFAQRVGVDRSTTSE